jgi:hypothetical protein
VTPPPEGFAFFCDDVREEVGGKVSYMGVLGPRVRASGRTLNLVAVLLLRAIEQEIAIRARLNLVFADAEPRERLIEKIVCKHPDDDAETWLIQFHGRISLALAEKPVHAEAVFDVGERVFACNLAIEANSASEPKRRNRKAVAKRVASKPR